MAFLLEQLGPEAVEVLGIVGLFVAFAGGALSGSLVVIESGNAKLVHSLWK